MSTCLTCARWGAPCPRCDGSGRLPRYDICLNCRSELLINKCECGETWSAGEHDFGFCRDCTDQRIEHRCTSCGLAWLTTEDREWIEERDGIIDQFFPDLSDDETEG